LMMEAEKVSETLDFCDELMWLVIQDLITVKIIVSQIHYCDMVDSVQKRCNFHRLWMNFHNHISILLFLLLSIPVCVNISYLVHDYGISFTVTLNDYTIYNETVSGKYIFYCVCVHCS
jgi:hypothetical protein